MKYSRLCDSKCNIDDNYSSLVDNYDELVKKKVKVMKKIAIISGTTRPNSRTLKVVKWIYKKAETNISTFDIIDLKEFNLPHFNEPKSPKSALEYKNQKTKIWSETIKQYDGYIFVIPEYNGFFPGVVKDAVDFLYREWVGKPFGLVGLGGRGGKWACDHLRTLLERFDMEFKGYVGIVKPWDNIDSDGNVDETTTINSINNLINNFK